jgi:transketolase N-terminal domain/subunit
MKRVVADSPRHDILNLGWNVLVVNPSDVEEIKSAIKKQML